MFGLVYLFDVILLLRSQSLINLFLTGRAVSNVWDNDKDLEGLSKYCSYTSITNTDIMKYCIIRYQVRVISIVKGGKFVLDIAGFTKLIS